MSSYRVPPPDTSSDRSPPAAQLEGIVDRLTFHSTESGYMVARVQAKGERKLITIVGSFPQIEPGQTLRFLGSGAPMPSMGISFKLASTRNSNRQPSRALRSI